MENSTFRTKRRSNYEANFMLQYQRSLKGKKERQSKGLKVMGLCSPKRHCTLVLMFWNSSSIFIGWLSEFPSVQNSVAARNVFWVNMGLQVTLRGAWQTKQHGWYFRMKVLRKNNRLSIRRDSTFQNSKGSCVKSSLLTAVHSCEQAQSTHNRYGIPVQQFLTSKQTFWCLQLL